MERTLHQIITDMRAEMCGSIKTLLEKYKSYIQDCGYSETLSFDIVECEMIYILKTEYEINRSTRNKRMATTSILNSATRLDEC